MITNVNLRIRFVIDPDASFEECNGKGQPLTREEYEREGYYMACPIHPRDGVTTEGTTLGKTVCNTCAHEAERVPYKEYLAYYGNPERHVYLMAEVQRQCDACGAWHAAGGTGWIDFMDDSPEAQLAPESRWYTPAELQAIPGYLREIAEQDFGEAASPEMAPKGPDRV